MSNINISKTSFKFVIYKQQSNLKTEEDYLSKITRPKNIYGEFDFAVDVNKNSKYSHREIMRRAANKFCIVRFETETVLDNSSFGEILFIALKIQKTGEVEERDCKILSDYYRQLIDKSRNLNIKGVKIMTMLWDNYFYHNIIPADSATAESISSLIRAIHIGYVKNLTFTDNKFKYLNSEASLNIAIKSKIILPNKLFLNDF